MNALDPRLVEDAANRLDTDEGLVEKDWHVVRAISVIAALDHDGMQPAFSGGTSLSAAWGLIKRFSEDIDFKVATPAASSNSQARSLRRRYRENVLAALGAADVEIIGEPLVGNVGNFSPPMWPTPALRSVCKRVYIAGVHTAMKRDYASLTATMARVIARWKRRAASGGR